MLNGNSGGPDIYFFGNFRLFYVRKPMERDITIEGEIGTNRLKKTFGRVAVSAGRMARARTKVLFRKISSGIIY